MHVRLTRFLLLLTSTAVLSAGALSASAVVGTATMTPAGTTAGTTAGVRTGETIRLDSASPGRTFDGVGFESASSSRLLIDYPEPERSQILDYLFKPGYGAAMQILEVEIGSDVNSTTVSEPSHERTAGAIDCNRGVEWWLMEQAKRRNPAIKLWGIPFGFPGWVGKLWSDAQVTYATDWLTCAKQHGLTIDYLGGSNQRGGVIPPSFFTKLRASARTVFPDLQIVASDQGGTPPYWTFAGQVLKSPELQQAVDVIGETTVCGWRTQYRRCDGPSDPTWNDAIATGKPLWDSSISTAELSAGGPLMARSLNRSYVQARITGHNYFSPVSAIYGDGWDSGIGLIGAQWPWSGYYTIGQGLWTTAHTTQFTRPGWRYLDDASGNLSNGATYVTLRSPTSSGAADWSTVIESLDATRSETVTLDVGDGLSGAPVQVWSTDVATPSPRTDFQHVGALPQRHGSVTFTVRPGHVYTLSTLRSAHKGTAAPRASADARLPLPYAQNFDRVPTGTQVPYETDPNGGFEAGACTDRPGTCLKQVVTTQPLIWQRGGSMAPTALVGDPLWNGDYTVSADARTVADGTVSLLGRVERWNKDAVIGYFLDLSADGIWRLRYQRQADTWTQNWNGPAGSAVDDVLASGTVPVGAAGSWHRLALSMLGDRINVSIDGSRLASVRDGRSTSGQVGVRVSGWQAAEFDNLRVTPTRPQDRVLATSATRATASTAQQGPLQYADFDPANVLDSQPETEWMSSFCGDVAEASWDDLCPAPTTAPLPQTLTLSLRHARDDVGGLRYVPPVGNTRVGPDGIITGYRLQVSTDGRRFRDVAAGSWSLDIGTKTVRWRPVRHTAAVRLVATAADGGVAGASEVRLLLDARSSR